MPVATRCAMGATLGVLVWLLFMLVLGEDSASPLLPWFWPFGLCGGLLGLTELSLLFAAGTALGALVWVLFLMVFSSIATIIGANWVPLPVSLFPSAALCGGLLAHAIHGLTTSHTARQPRATR